jgi:hypothetical protein
MKSGDPGTCSAGVQTIGVRKEEVTFWWPQDEIRGPWDRGVLSLEEQEGGRTRRDADL